MNLKGADPRNSGRQPKDWLSGTLRGTFLTLTGSSRSWRSSTDVLDFAYCKSEIAPGGIFVFYRSSRCSSGTTSSCPSPPLACSFFVFPVSTEELVR